MPVYVIAPKRSDLLDGPSTVRYFRARDHRTGEVLLIPETEHAEVWRMSQEKFQCRCLEGFLLLDMQEVEERLKG